MNLSRSSVEASRPGSPSRTTRLRIPSRGWTAHGVRESCYPQVVDGSAPSRDQRQLGSQYLPGPRGSTTVTPNNALQRTRAVLSLQSIPDEFSASRRRRTPLSLGSLGELGARAVKSAGAGNLSVSRHRDYDVPPGARATAFSRPVCGSEDHGANRRRWRGGELPATCARARDGVVESAS